MFNGEMNAGSGRVPGRPPKQRVPHDDTEKHKGANLSKRGTKQEPNSNASVFIKRNGGQIIKYRLQSYIDKRA